MKKYVAKKKAGFIICNTLTGHWLHECKAKVLGKGGIFSKAAYDWEKGKFGAAVFTREKASRVIKYLRSSGFDCKRKPVGKSTI